MSVLGSTQWVRVPCTRIRLQPIGRFIADLDAPALKGISLTVQLSLQGTCTDSGQHGDAPALSLPRLVSVSLASV